MATDSATLLDESKCYACNSANPYALTLMKLALLRQTLLYLDPMADTSAATLLDEAKCYACFASNTYTATLLELALLAQIANAGGLGGTSFILLQDAPPGPVPADLTKVWMVNYRDGSPSQIYDPSTGGWI